MKNQKRLFLGFALSVVSLLSGFYGFFIKPSPVFMMNSGAQAWEARMKPVKLALPKDVQELGYVSDLDLLINPTQEQLFTEVDLGAVVDLGPRGQGPLPRPREGDRVPRARDGEEPGPHPAPPGSHRRVEGAKGPGGRKTSRRTRSTLKRGTEFIGSSQAAKEALFTMDEETGMTGANHLKSGILKGDILMNLDSEDEGELYVGCAGGVDVNVKMNYNQLSVPSGFVAYELSVTGLKGGHSGMDINIGRSNSNKLLFRFLNHCLYNFDIKLSEVKGGSLRNAIPRESFAIVLIQQSETAKFETEVEKFEKIFASEFAKTEPELKMKAVKANVPQNIIEQEAMVKIIKATYACPHGVERMSDAMPGLVETSNNLAIVKCIDGLFSVNCLVRSSVDSAKEGAMYKIGTIFDLIGANVSFDGAYPGWKPNMDSPILKTMLSTYENLYGKTPEIKAIHAGLECGILGAAYPNWDMISFGPTIRFPHSPDEKVNIPSVEKFWNYIVETLKNVPVKK